MELAKQIFLGLLMGTGLNVCPQRRTKIKNV
jgi:hypothetical protein